ncbi:hypothetical protein KY290_007984 [Solanum tuberosum]|uniref:Retrotransposon gag domain-containing protein n=1 Tax=Solanum tuberosum TaxID=4113 RepID=A0ABQ7W744_SOLTU|nr:hypothetical protein KY290_007984 [Solanum tuberosum]
MTRSSSKEVIKYNPELEKTLRFLKKELAERFSGNSHRLNTMGDINAGNRGLNDSLNLDNLNRTHEIEDDAEHPGVVNRRIHRLLAEVEDQMDQNNGRAGRLLGDYAKPNYNGMQSNNEDPTSHLMDFDEIMNTFHYNGTLDDAIYLRSIHIWDEMMTKFLDKYFSPAKIARMRKEINNFSQLESETVFEAWERFKELLRKCPYNGIEP